MRKIYFSALVLSSLTAGATLTNPEALQITKAADRITATSLKNSASTTINKLKHLPKEFGSNTPERISIIPIEAPSTESGYALNESFENWDGEDVNWTPSEWTVEMRGEVGRENSWTPEKANSYIPGTEGSYMYAITYSDDKNQDEWLISPYFNIDEAMSLSFKAFFQPPYLFNLDNIDWDTFEFIGDKIVAATLQIWIQTESEEWAMMHDFVDDYKDMNYMQMAQLTPNSLEKHSFPLDNYAGKTARIALRYVGKGGNTMYVDAIKVGYPELSGINYMEPTSMLYWGFDGNPDLNGLMGAIAQAPVYTPLTWTNLSNHVDATYEWQYDHPETHERVTSDNQEELTLTFVPDYTDEETMRNNLYEPVSLTATAPHAVPGIKTSPYIYLQAGGKPERTLNDATEFEADMLPFPQQILGLTMTTIDDAAIGDNALPVFGYNVNVDKYWLNYSLNGSEPDDTNFSHLIGISNILLPSEAPLVVNGVNVYGFGQIGDDVEFTATIYGMNADMEASLETMEVMATATIKGADVKKLSPTQRGNLAFEFNFETPAIVKATEEHPAYIIMFTGFHNEDVSYFAPFQSNAPEPNGMCFGYIYNHINMESQSGRPEYWSLKRMVYKTDDYVDPTGAFAIALKGEYPWLTADSKDITLNDENNEMSITLGSYYDGSQLTVIAPEGITATVEGRYNKCKLNVKRNNTATDIDGNIVVKGNGVELTIPVKANASGIGSINGNDIRTISGIYDMYGRRVLKTGNGVYLIKYSNGTCEKKVVK